MRRLRVAGFGFRVAGFGLRVSCCANTLTVSEGPVRGFRSLGFGSQ